MTGLQRTASECAKPCEERPECLGFIFDWAELSNNECEIGHTAEEIRVYASGKESVGDGHECKCSVLIKCIDSDLLLFKNIDQPDTRYRRNIIKIEGRIHSRTRDYIVGHAKVKKINFILPKRDDRKIIIDFNHIPLFDPFPIKGLDNANLCRHGPMELSVSI